MEHTKPNNNEPVSPINICAGVILYLRKAIIEPANENATMAISTLSIIKNHDPIVRDINNPIPPDNPLIPSMRLKALMITIIVNIDSIILTGSGNTPIPNIPYKLVNLTLDLNTSIAAANN